MTSLWPAGLSARMVAFGPGSIRGTPANGRPWWAQDSRADRPSLALRPSAPTEATPLSRMGMGQVLRSLVRFPGIRRVAVQSYVGTDSIVQTGETGNRRTETWVTLFGRCSQLTKERGP